MGWNWYNINFKWIINTSFKKVNLILVLLIKLTECLHWRWNWKSLSVVYDIKRGVYKPSPGWRLPESVQLKVLCRSSSHCCRALISTSLCFGSDDITTVSISFKYYNVKTYVLLLHSFNMIYLSSWGENTFEQIEVQL